MQGLRKVLERSSLVSCGALLFGLSHCSGGEFSAGSGASGNDTGGSKPQGGSGGGDAGGSAGGDAGGGAAGAAGTGGSGPPGCECPPGNYCLEGSTDCLACSDLSRLYFDPPVRLATVSDNGAGSRFPRIGATSTDLLYRFDGVGMRYTADSSTSAGSSVSSTVPEDSAPLLLREPVTTVSADALPSFNFLFDRSVEGVRTLFAGSWEGGLRDGAVPLPAFNGGWGNYSAAVALHATPGTGRLFWMSVVGLEGPSKLVTAPLEAHLAPADVELQLNVGGTEACAPLEPSVQGASQEVDPDLTPWVTSDGGLLVFAATRLEAGCAAGNRKKDIYTALLHASTGQPAAPALPMKDVNSAADDVDPSFSADLCDLYFSSNRDGKFAVYRAHRR